MASDEQPTVPGDDEPAVSTPQIDATDSATSSNLEASDVSGVDDVAVAEATGQADPELSISHTVSNTNGKAWYVLKVQSNREDSIREAILKRVKIAGLEEYLSEILVPTEKVTEIKSGKKRVTERKFYPGYVMVNIDLNDDIWFVIRETPGVGDFVGSGGKPLPMTAIDIEKMLGRKAEVEGAAGPRLKINFQKGDRVKIKEGTFENFEGDVDEVIEAKGLVRVMIQIFGRPTPVELEYWQVEPI